MSSCGLVFNLRLNGISRRRGKMLGIFIGLVLLMVLAYRGWSIIWIAPICAGIVALFGGLNLLDAYTGYIYGWLCKIR
jgi:hypothetical protein